MTGDLKVEKKTKKAGKGPFQTLGLSEAVCMAIGKLGFKLPTPIQRKAIPAILRGSDCVAMARTGSGKTGAFLLPMISKLDSHSETVGVRALVLSPTRELAMQTAKVCRTLIKFTDLRCTLLVGGQSMETQFDKLTNNPDIIIATPGRLLHHMKEAGLSLERSEFLVFDEADRLFELGMSDQLHDILSNCPVNRQALLFSATLPTKLVEFARVGLKNAEYIKLDSEHTLSDTLSLFSLFVRTEAKKAALIRTLLQLDVTAPGKKTIVFAATRHHVDFFEMLLNKHGISSAGVYGSMDQICRTNALSRFRAGKVSVLVVTDVAARGIDIPLLDYVINYDFPPSPKLFIHRAGRTARNGQSGVCVNLVTADDIPYLLELMLFLGKDLEMGGIPDTAECEESVRKAISEDAALESGHQSMTLAYGPYFKTRPSASKQSVKRAKDFVASKGGYLSILGVPHKMFIETSRERQGLEGVDNSFALRDLLGIKEDVLGEAAVNSDEPVEDFIAQLRTFRPNNLEAAISSEVVGKFNKAVVAPKKLRLEIREVMVKKVQDEAYEEVETNDEVLDGEESTAETPARFVQADSEFVVTVSTTRKRTHAQLTRGVSVFDQTTCRSADFFLGATKTADENANSVFDLQGLDIVPDDSNDMRKNMTVKKWDNKRKKYVLMQLGPDGRPLKQNRVVNESGKRLKNKEMADGEMYAKWSKNTQKRLQRPGEQEKTYGKVAESKVVDFSDEGEDEDNGAVESKKYHGKVPKQFLTNKQKRKEKQVHNRSNARVTSRGDETRASKMKGVEQLASDRLKLKTKKIMQNPKARKEFNKKSKDSYMAKVNAKINRPHKNSRSRVVGGR